MIAEGLTTGQNGKKGLGHLHHHVTHAIAPRSLHALKQVRSVTILAQAMLSSRFGSDGFWDCPSSAKPRRNVWNPKTSRRVPRGAATLSRPPAPGVRKPTGSSSCSAAEAPKIGDRKTFGSRNRGGPSEKVHWDWGRGFNKFDFPGPTRDPANQQKSYISLFLDPESLNFIDIEIRS